MGNELVNAPNTNAEYRGETNQQHQKVAKPIVLKDPTMLLTTHQVRPQTSNPTTGSEHVHNDDNHEPIQLDEVVSTWQQWQFPTLGYYLPRTYALTPIAIFIGFQY